MANKIKFTKTAVAALPAPTKARDTYYDTLVPKLAVLVTAKSKNFYVVKRAGREMVWLKLGTFPDMTVERAREEAEKIIGEFAANNNPAATRRALKEELTLEEFFEKEYGPRHGEKLVSWRTAEQQFRDYIKPLLGKKKLSAVDRQQIARILSDLDKKGLSGSSVNKVRNLVSGMYHKAIEWGFAENNPASGIGGRKGVKRDRFIQAHELPRFFVAVANEENPDIRDYILLSLLSGARKGNVVEMRWEDIQLDDGIWRIPKTKNDDPQNVTLAPEAVEVLKSREGNESEWVFPGIGKTGHLVEPKSGWKRVLDRDEVNQLQARIKAAGLEFDWPLPLVKPAGHKGRIYERVEDALDRARKMAADSKIDTLGTRLPDLRIHDLRRTLGSWQAKTGASLVVIGKSLNHKSTSTTAIYARLDLDPVRHSVNTATAAMLEAGGLKQTAQIKPLKKSNTAA
jgi:integrase